MFQNPAIPRFRPDDSRLVRLAARGDEGAFATIYERYGNPLYRYCMSILGDAEDARDALQSTMLKALRALPRQDHELALKPWLYRIAHNESISLLRQRRPQVELQESDERPADSTEQIADGRVRFAQLMRDLRELPERQRSALVLRELSGLTFEDLGQTLGVSPEAAKQTVYEARKALTEHAAGRELGCDAVQNVISSRDRRQLRARQLRGHLRSCLDCRTFNDAIGDRTAAYAALVPALPIALSAELLRNVLAGAGSGTAGAAATGAASGGGLLGGTGALGKSLAAGAAAKSIAVGAATIVAAGAAFAVAVSGRSASDDPPAAKAQPASADKPATAGRRSARRDGRTQAARPGSDVRHRGSKASRRSSRRKRPARVPNPSRAAGSADGGAQAPSAKTPLDTLIAPDIAAEAQRLLDDVPTAPTAPSLPDLPVTPPTIPPPPGGAGGVALP